MASKTPSSTPSSTPGQPPSEFVSKFVRKRVSGIVENSRVKLPDNILGIDNNIYQALCRVCTIGINNGERNGIVRIVLSVLTPSLFFICNSIDKIRNFLHESLILGQMGSSGLRFDKDGLSLDAIAEVFLDIHHDQLHFSRQSHHDNDAKRAHIRHLYKDTETNHAAGMFFMEHPGLIPYATYITKKLFPFGIGRSCFVGAGGNGVVIKNQESNLAFKFYYDLQRKKFHTALKEGPSQVVFSRAINDLHQEGKCSQFSAPFMEVLADNHVEMELVEGETLDTLFKRFLLVSNHIFLNADHLRGTELDIELRKSGLTIADFSVVEMIKNLYGQTEADSFSYFLLELEERGLVHRDIDSTVYSGSRTNVNPKNLMVRSGFTGDVPFVIIDFGNVTIEDKNGHTYKQQYDLISKNGYV